MANPQRAIQECLEVAVAEASHDCDLILLNASIPYLTLLPRYANIAHKRGLLPLHVLVSWGARGCMNR